MARSVAAVTDARNMSMELTKLVDIVTSWIFFMLILIALLSFGYVYIDDLTSKYNSVEELQE